MSGEGAKPDCSALETLYQQTQSYYADAASDGLKAGAKTLGTSAPAAAGLGVAVLCLLPDVTISKAACAVGLAGAIGGGTLTAVNAADMDELADKANALGAVLQDIRDAKAACLKGEQHESAAALAAVVDQIRGTGSVKQQLDDLEEAARETQQEVEDAEEDCECEDEDPLDNDGLNPDDLPDGDADLDDADDLPDGDGDLPGGDADLPDGDGDVDGGDRDEGPDHGPEPTNDDNDNDDDDLDAGTP